MHPTAVLVREIKCSGTPTPCGLPMARLWRYMGRQVLEVVSCGCDIDQPFMGASPARERVAS